MTQGVGIFGCGVAIKIGATILCLCMVFPRNSVAFLYPLHDTEVRGAYFLGRTTDTKKLAEFFDKYARHFPIPERGPDIDEIEFRTPYEVVVRRSWERWMNYTEQDAEKDYEAQPNLIVVSVDIYRTVTFPRFVTNPSESKTQKLERPEVFWGGFRFRVMQDEHAIQPNKVSSRLLYHRGTGLGGVEMLLEFSAAEFVSSGTAKVEVLTPDGQSAEATFELDKLK